jgi:selenocysteine-specific elongation factor
VDRCEQFRERHPLRWGPSREELRAAVAAESSAPVFGELLDELAARSEVALSGDKVRVGGGDVLFEGEAARERDRISAAFRVAGCSPPDPRDVVGKGGRLAEEVVLALLDQGELEKVATDVVFHRDAMGRARQALAAIQARDGSITVGAFRDELGISRKYAVPLLEHFDALRVTRRDGDSRTLR